MSMMGHSTPDTIGLPYMVVVVDDVQGDLGIVRDQYGKYHSIRADVRRGKGALPQSGETWIVDRTLGHWTFAACLVPELPIVTGSTGGIPALESLLDALESMGFISNDTTPGPA